MLFALGLSIVLVVYNNLINQWRPFHGPAYVPVNLAFAATTTLLTAIVLDLEAGALGLQGDLADLGLPLALVAAFAVAMYLFVRSRYGSRIDDARIRGLSGSALAFYVLVRIPLGTAVTEEVLFRGTLFATWREAGVSSIAAATYSSVAFGLWHIAPTIIGVRMNDRDGSRRKMTIAVVGAVIATTLVGLALTWVRLETGGVLAPIVLHAGINSVAALGAVAARRFRS